MERVVIYGVDGEAIPLRRETEQRGSGASRSSARERSAGKSHWIPGAHQQGQAPHPGGRIGPGTLDKGRGRVPRTRLIAASTASGYASPVQRSAATRKTTRAGTVP